AEDKVFGAVVKPEAGATEIEYYIYAENARAAKFSPTRYMFEQYTATLEELNN
ncbi:MAG: hypothetical protein HRU12_25245, partial [Phaeodactylibacter sp.]|nr:hypothetical protein [Phaeodactylibacter sp.]